MVFPVVGGTQDTGYEISNSLRFNGGNDAEDVYLTRDYSSAGNQVTWTFSCWVKRTILGEERPIFAAQESSDLSSGDPQFAIFFHTTDQLRVWTNTNASIYTNRLFRDVGAWYHIHLKASSSSPYFNLYINGVEETSFDTDNRSSYPGGNNSYFNSAKPHFVGGWRNGSIMSPGMYLSNFAIVDGTAHAPTDFGETNDNGVWVPKRPDVSAWGTNGCFLEFKQTGTSANASGIGADTSGQGNHMSVVSLTSTDVTTDTPTNNFATINSLIRFYSGESTSEGNVKSTATHASVSGSFWGTIPLTNGKWYWESKITTLRNAHWIGVSDNLEIAGLGTTASAARSYGIFYKNNGKKSIDETESNYGDTYAQGDIIGVALDMDNKNIYFSKNGTFQNSGDPTSGSTGTGKANSSALEDIVLPACMQDNGDATVTEWNFGNPSFSISSSNADANGYGNFEYSVPSGYYALCTKNLAEYG